MGAQSLPKEVPEIKQNKKKIKKILNETEFKDNKHIQHRFKVRPSFFFFNSLIEVELNLQKPLCIIAIFF